MKVNIFGKFFVKNQITIWKEEHKHDVLTQYGDSWLLGPSYIREKQETNKQK